MKKIVTLSAAAAVIAVLAQEPAAAQDERQLKVSNVFPERHYLWQQGGKIFTDAVSEATGGKVKFENYHAGQLGKDQLGLLSTGLATMAVVAAPYAPDKLPLSGVTELPGFATTSCDATSRLWKIARSGGALHEAELKRQGLHVLFVAVPPAYKFMTTKVKVDSLEKMAGLKMRAIGGAQAETIRALGGTPIPVQPADLYDSLSRGTIDGAIYINVGIPPFGLERVVRYSVEGAYAGSAAVLYSVSTKYWEALPKDLQAVFTAAAAKAQDHLCRFQDGDEIKEGDALVSKHGLTVTRLPEAEAKRWSDKMAPVAKSWADKLDAAGRQGSAILEAYAKASGTN